MAILPRIYFHQAELEEPVKRVEQEFSPDVVRIRYSIDDDWTGDPSIFFRILLSDSASRPESLRSLVPRIDWRLREEVQPDELGIHAYTSVRSATEQAELNDPDCA